ncbi:MAG: isoprenylcysteine carboxylmethyltransferase family protein, partial [Anaerolineae bacterium]|nr:isoprenylcysteine carboxylmethyltransferase family protein [Anaerolineae bacterium]
LGAAQIDSWRNEKMEWFPGLELVWLNGWILLVPFYAVFGLLLLIFPREVVRRLYHKSGWSRWQMIMSVLTKLAALIFIVLILATPLRIGTSVLGVGIVLYLFGFVLMVVALIHYRQTPMGEAVVKGVYRISRNPQWVALVLVVFGIAIAIGSWTAITLAVVMVVAGHFRILAEEEVCLEQYGESYRRYMERVPRYLWVV